MRCDEHNQQRIEGRQAKGAHGSGLDEAVVDEVADGTEDVRFVLVRELATKTVVDLARDVSHAERHVRRRDAHGPEEGVGRRAQILEICMQRR